MHGACSTYWERGGGEVHTWFGLGNRKQIIHLEIPGIDGRIILRWIFRKWDGGYGLN
jgi:hypothetical protein